MKEEFLHYLWKYRLYDNDVLSDTAGNHIEVVDPGEYNRDAGPDFFNAKIRIGDILWAGNVEIHVKSSYFEQHGHHYDHAYDNVILHVVAEDDKDVRNSRGEKMPTVVLHFDCKLLERYENLVNDPHKIACHFHIGKFDKIYVSQWYGALVVERLEKKVSYVDGMLADTNNDWNEVFYRLLSRYFGFKVNSEPFELLAKAIPSKILLKHADNRLQVEAMLFGTAGLLDGSIFKEAIDDVYYQLLLREYMVLSSKYSLKPIHGWLWKFGKLRPQNFPTVRIAQMASLICDNKGLFSKILETNDKKQICEMFDVTASRYWDNHYVFGKQSNVVPKTIGESAINLLIVNVVSPLLFVYGKRHDDYQRCEEAIDLLYYTSAEDNVVVRDWKDVGLAACNGFESQAILQLMTCYCSKRRCVECRIGVKILYDGLELINHQDLALEP